MKVILGSLLIISLLGCGTRSRHVTPANQTNLQRLQTMYDLYSVLYTAQADSDGFVETNWCDSLTETGFSNPNANLVIAEVSPGQWLRRPTTYTECYKSKGSATDISRDGILAVMWYSLENKRLDLLTELWNYGTNNNWVMGLEGDLPTRMMNPYMIALLAQEIYYLGGGDYAIRFTLYPDTSPNGASASELQAIQNLIKWKTLGTQQVGDMAFVKQLIDSAPINPLYAYLAGQLDTSAALLLQYWPNDRLPTSADNCTDWRISQDNNGSGLVPCPKQGLTHSGGDFLLVARLILKGY